MSSTGSWIFTSKEVSHTSRLLWTTMVIMFTCHVCLTIFQRRMSGCSLPSHSVVNSDEVVMKFCKEGALISIPIDRNATNLPIMHNSFMSKKVKREHASKFRSALHATGLYAALDYFANVSVNQNLSTLSRKQDPVSCFPCVGGLKNKNLSMPQKELLLWHWKLGIGMQCLQSMMQN